MQLLDGDVVAIMGGGSGLGLGVARHCLGEGASLAILEVVPEKVEQLRAEFGSDAVIVQGDATSVSDLQRFRSETVARFGKVNALIGCQGIFDGNIPLADTPLDRIDSLFDEVFHINVKSYILAVKVFLDELDKTSGAVVLTSSMAAFAADGGGLFYTASKGAVKSVVNQLGFELAPRIRVNGVAPAGIANSQLRGPAALGLEGQKQSDIPKDLFLKQYRMLTPLQELPTPEDHGPLYAFLASRHNKLVTGQVYVADQGLLNRAMLSLPVT